MADDMTATINNTSQDNQNVSQDTQAATVKDNTSSKAKDDSKDNQDLSIDELIQRAVDRATNKLGNDNKKLRDSLTKLQKEHLNENELKAIELEEKEKDIADREAKLQEKINREYALKAIKEAGLDDGGSNSLELIDFVVCDNEKDTLSRVKAFGELVNKFVAAEVDKTFKKNGRDPNGASSNSDTTPSVAEQLGKMRAAQAKKSNDTLNYYLGR